MLASLLRPKKRRVYAERSPFSSPYTTRDLPWPFLQRGSEEQYEEVQGNDDDANQGVDDGEEDESGDEDDGPSESSPLLPIFSASHLGIYLFALPAQCNRLRCLTGVRFVIYRYAPRLRYHPCDSRAYRSPLRDYVVLGSVAVAPDLSISGKTYPATD